MFKAKSRSVFVLASVVVALVSSVALAERGPKGGGPDEGGAMLLQRFDEVDANKDGLLTEAEMQAFRAARFAAADTDGNGSLSVEELSVMQMQQMQDRAAQRSAKLLKRLDANGDGQLSAEEMAKMERSGKGKSGKGKAMFERADADGDGMISKAEAEAAAQDMGKRGGRKCKDKQAD